MDKKQSTPEKKSATTHANGVSIVIAVIFYIAAFLGAMWMDSAGIPAGWSITFGVIMTLIGTYFLIAIKIASQWEKAIVLRFGKFHALKGPGLFWIVPIMDTVANWIDHRVMVIPFNAEKTLTKDTVPVDVDAVLFWMVWDAEKAAL